MANVRLKWNMGTFIAISNQVNAAVCAPAAERVKAAVSDAQWVTFCVTAICF